ncbi:sulfotransferase family 2 domain-containing protein [Alteromonas sp. B31-7]|uniref:sulfotransferase family 2 domain-containing protein n=1 Tax=Alteromonas sp. B31-7 TaxID=2785913 RepID=UPI0018CAB621|nr:sulfotransferase family 2 domain-containing protein [Alteromonas sp. B31-7]QPL50565.1 sulfotransferase family 2 domain-containing protein [Alteromonas sp. B31-7]
MIEDSEINMLYRSILGRSPESDEVYTEIKEHIDSIENLRKRLLSSNEFKLKFVEISSQIENSIPNVNNPIVFLHIPKCAGTSIDKYLESAFLGSKINFEKFNLLEQQSLNQIRKYKIHSGHFDFNSLKALGLASPPTTILSCFREPMSRLESIYNYFRAHSESYCVRKSLDLPLIAKRTTPEEFFFNEKVFNNGYFNNCYVRSFLSSTGLPKQRWEKSTKGELANIQLKELTEALFNLKNVNVFILNENLESELNEFISSINGNPSDLPHLQDTLNKSKTDSNMELIEKVCFNADTKEKLRPLVEYDLVLFKILNLFKNNRAS